MSTALIIILSWLAFDVVVYICMWIEHHNSLKGFVDGVHKFIEEMNEEE